MDYSKAIRQVTDRRRRALDRASDLKRKLIETDQDFYENEKALRLAEIAVARGKNADIKKLQSERASILKSHGLEPSDLTPSPECSLCGDTGFFKGKICRCAVKVLLAESNAQGIPVRTLDELDVNSYCEKFRECMEKIKGKLKKYIDTFPAEGVQNLIFIGRPGSGKTFCASVVAGEVMRCGYSVATMTAFGFVEAMRTYHTTFDDGKESLLSPVLESDLLVIDDLGTESILKNITLEYLYLVLNERMMNFKHTLITTNLTPDEIAFRYGERTASRLFDKKSAYAVSFPNEDLRDAIKRKK